MLHQNIWQNALQMVDNKFIILLTALILIDIATGLLKSLVASNTNSKTVSDKGLLGILKHCLVFIVVLVMYPIAETIGFQTYADWLLVYFIITYAVSIMENWGQAGLPLPSWVKDRLAKLQDDYDHKGDDKNA
jgi:toxin secretion/phage lysis holin|nr:MAG TPA_asm: holin [Caudoviricetes sp.]